jgi:hypothetical protein
LYSDNSAWNTPIPANVPVHPNSGTFINAIVQLQSQLNDDLLDYTTSSVPQLAYPTSSTPNVTLFDNDPSCKAQVLSLPIPAGTVVEQQFSSKLALMMPDGGEWDIYGATPPGVTPLNLWGHCANGDPSQWNATGPVYYHKPGWNGTGYDYPGPLQGSTRATHTWEGAGTTLLRDMGTSNSDFGHALAVSYGLASNGSVYPKVVPPAMGGDGPCRSGYSGNQCVPEGARLQLDPSINCDTWPSLANGPEWKKKVCRTLQRYGFIITDNTEGTGGMVNQYQSSAPFRSGTQRFNGLNGFSWGDSALPRDLTSHLRVIDWNVWCGC